MQPLHDNNRTYSHWLDRFNLSCKERYNEDSVLRLNLMSQFLSFPPNVMMYVNRTGLPCAIDRQSWYFVLEQQGWKNDVLWYQHCIVGIDYVIEQIN